MNVMVTRLILFLWVLLCQSMHAFHQEEYFLRGNVYASKSEWQKALDEYEHISNKSAIVLHNMAVCLYELQEFDRAHLCWRAALRIADRSHYMQIAGCLNQKFHDDSNVSFFAWLSAGYSLFCFQILMLLFWYLGMICMIFCKRYRIVLAIGCGVLLLLTACCMYSKYYDQYSYALIREQDQMIFSGPSYHYSNHGMVGKGSLVRVIEQRDDWYRITAGDISGWISASHIECR